MDFIKKEDIVTLDSDFQVSHQLLWNENSNSKRITITKVHVYPEKTNQRHKHESSEQIWIALKGRGTLLLNDDKTLEINEGDVVRFADGETHGITNNSDEEFIYISITSPPINFRYAYKGEKKN
jgi:quercetin dioxygenase-like cupin family protein